MGFLAELACALIIGGCAGILIDRLRFGFVIDWLDFGPRSEFVYNLADLAVISAAVFLCSPEFVSASIIYGSSRSQLHLMRMKTDVSTVDPEESGRMAAQQLKAALRQPAAA